MNSFGRLFRISIFGESHGPCIGVLIDGCPAGIEVAENVFELDMSRRRGGQKPGTTPRKEEDKVLLQSGVFNGKTTGAPILMEIANTDVRSGDYEKIKDTPRPGHADWVAWKKYGALNDYRGGGHFSGRLTAGLVAAGVLAKAVAKPCEITAKVLQVGGMTDYGKVIEDMIAEGDSVGGLVECRVGNVPAGLGEPFFDSVEALISHLVFSIPAIKGIEFGSGFASSTMRGSQFNDDIVDSSGKTATNHAGGILGGITNGNEVVFRVAVKPTPSIRKEKKTVNLVSGAATAISTEGRHDACVALRVPVVLEAVTALVLADLLLLEQMTKRVVR